MNKKNLVAFIKKARETATDEVALQAKELYNGWKAGKNVAVGERYRHGDKLYKVIQAHTTQADWTPDVTPALWSAIGLAPDMIPVWSQPTGSHDAYNIGDRVHYPGKDDPVYESTVDGNIWSPEAYPQGWVIV